MGRRGAGAGLTLVLGLAAVAGCYREARTEWAWHRVAAGETLSAIAARHHVAITAIAEANALESPDAIRDGELLYIPPPAERRTNSPTEKMTPRVARTLHPVEKGALAWPVAAKISSRFGLRDGRPHEGIDLAVGDGTEVRAAGPGKVVYSGAGLRGYGNLVMVQHESGLLTIYAHNQSLLVGEGATVERGQVISLSGHSGRATAPHLHFEVREGDVPRDPELYLPPHP
jgi:murein DD-endopeptidase MepM/ murein hydrolase activator NlpD